MEYKQFKISLNLNLIFKSVFCILKDSSSLSGIFQVSSINIK